jgi:hypothetical protein
MARRQLVNPRSSTTPSTSTTQSANRQRCGEEQYRKTNE